MNLSGMLQNATVHGSVTTKLCAKFLKDSCIDKEATGKQDFKIKMKDYREIIYLVISCKFQASLSDNFLCFYATDFENWYKI